MTLSNFEHKDIMNAYEQRRLSNHKLQEDHKKEIYDILPRIKEIDQEIASNSIALGRKLIFSDNDDIKKEFQDKHMALVDEKKSLLQSNNYPCDYLEPIYDCPKCKDTGYIGSKQCSCFKTQLISLLYSNSNLDKILDRENFECFNENYYSDKETSNGLPSPKKNIQGVLKICHRFIDNFPNKENLLFQGPTGVGKTFLTHCIAKEIMDHGYTCVYVTAFQLFETLANETFGKKDNVSVDFSSELLLTCDLLIIDDLGTELSNKFVISQLFQYLNERILREKSTIISTNLSLQQFRDTYSERIFSRVIEHYGWYKIYGDDIRLRKSNLT